MHGGILWEGLTIMGDMQDHSLLAFIILVFRFILKCCVVLMINIPNTVIG